MAVHSQRVNLLIKNYMKHFNDEMPIEKIAKLYGVTDATVYNVLGEIAELNGCERDDILYYPDRRPLSYSNVGTNKPHIFETSELTSLFFETKEKINHLLAKIDDMVKEDV